MQTVIRVSKASLKEKVNYSLNLKVAKHNILLETYLSSRVSKALFYSYSSLSVRFSIITCHPKKQKKDIEMIWWKRYLSCLCCISKLIRMLKTI